MKIKEIFKKQLDSSLPLQKETISKLSSSETSFGTKLEEGDKLLFFIAHGINLEVKTICERDFDKLNKQYLFADTKLNNIWPNFIERPK